jgi:23S rRNA pseudouridine1911/1915/1917 synthase
VGPESDRVYTITVRERDGNDRLDRFISSHVDDLTRTRAQALINERQVEVNGLPAKRSQRLKPGDVVLITIPPVRAFGIEPEPVPFITVYEDPFLIVLNKPAGVVVHPAPGHTKGTLVHGLLQHCKDLSGVGGVLRPGIVHRLDKDTSGLLVAAKNDRVHLHLTHQFKKGVVKKQYRALVYGVIQRKKGVIDLPIARHPKKRKEMSVQHGRGKEALTRWEKDESLCDNFSLLSLFPKTGRTHQIRVHLSYMGHPIAGDSIYGFRRDWWRKRHVLQQEVKPIIKRQMLHAEKLGFFHPEDDRKLDFEAPIPEDMAAVLMRLREMDGEYGHEKT